jgi:acyl-CoA synthetase (NDP forming)
VLGAVGIPIAAALLAGTEHEAVLAARQLGFPVALKATGPDIVHKTEVGGVRLGIADEAAVRATWCELKARLKSGLTGVLVQQMISGGVEMLIGRIASGFPVGTARRREWG